MISGPEGRGIKPSLLVRRSGTRRRIKRKVLNFVEKLTYSCATKVYPNSFGLKEIILNNNLIYKAKLKVLANGSSNGINTTYFNPNQFSEADKDTLRNKLQIQKNDFVFVFVGRLVADKGINELVAAFKKLQTKFPSREGLGVCEKSRITTSNCHPEFVEGNQPISKCKLLLVGPLETDLDPLKKNFTRNRAQSSYYFSWLPK